MSDYTINNGTLVNIANAIRAQEGTTDIIKVSDFADRISSLELSAYKVSGDISSDDASIYSIDNETLVAIGDAIREKEETTDVIPVSNFAERILNLCKTIKPSEVKWATSSYDEIAAMLEMHYQGIIDIKDYWNIGDTRYVSFSGYEAYDNGKTGYDKWSWNEQPAQTIGLVIVDFETHELSSQWGHYDHLPAGTKAAITLQFENCLSNDVQHHNTTDNMYGVYQHSMASTATSKIFNCLPDELRSLSKSVRVYYSMLNYSTPSSTMDNEYYVILPSMKEILGSDFNTSYDEAVYDREGTQFAYYKQGNSRYKKQGHGSTTDVPYLTRSVRNRNSWKGTLLYYITIPGSSTKCTTVDYNDTKMWIAPIMWL